jgi:hypothetical protein
LSDGNPEAGEQIGVLTGDILGLKLVVADSIRAAAMEARKSILRGEAPGCGNSGVS